MKNISKRTLHLAPSGIRRFFDLVMEMKNIISLGVGEPDFDTPWSIRETAIYSIEQGYTSYTSNKGSYELRLNIAKHMAHRHNISYNPETEVLVTTGVSEALDLAVRAVIDPGDEVIIPEPCYVSYGPVVSLSGGKPVFVPTVKNEGFKITPHDIEKALTKKTKAVIINYPANPTGASYRRAELNRLNSIIRRKNLIVISDEIYSALTYTYGHTPWPSLPGARQNCIYLNGFSKGYAMTGWRVGYAMGPAEIIGAMTKIHQYTMLSAPTPSQAAAVEAVKKGEGEVLKMLEEYKRRRNFVVNRLRQAGLECNMPDGAFYVFFHIGHTGMSAEEFAASLLKRQKVAVVPGTAFGPSGENYIRLSYASGMENLKEAMGRIEKFMAGIK